MVVQRDETVASLFVPALVSNWSTNSITEHVGRQGHKIYNNYVEHIVVRAA